MLLLDTNAGKQLDLEQRSHDRLDDKKHELHTGPGRKMLAPQRKPRASCSRQLVHPRKAAYFK